MAKKVTAMIKLRSAPQGDAAPPIGPCAGSARLNIPLLQGVHDRTAKQVGLIIPVVITSIRTAPSPYHQDAARRRVIKKACGISMPPASPTVRRSPNHQAQIRRNCGTQMPDLTPLHRSRDELVAGTARSMRRRPSMIPAEIMWEDTVR